MISLLRVATPGLVLFIAALGVTWTYGGRGRWSEILIHALLVLGAWWIMLYLALRDYSADSGADVLALIVLVGGVLLCAGSELALHYVGRAVSNSDEVRRLLRVAGFAAPPLGFLVVALVNAGAAASAKATETARVTTLSTPALLAEVEAGKVTVRIASEALRLKPGGGDELLDAVTARPPEQRAKGLLVAAASTIADKSKAIALAREGLSIEQTRFAAAALARSVGDPALVEPLRGVATKDLSDHVRRRIASARVACGDLQVLEAVVKGELDLKDEPAPDPKPLGAAGVARGEALLAQATSTDDRARAALLVGWLGDPNHRLDAIVFDAAIEPEVRRAAFDAWPKRPPKTPPELVLALYRPLMLDAARAQAKQLGAPMRDLCITHAKSGFRPLRDRCLELLGSFAADDAAFAALSAVAVDKSDSTELRAEALEAMAVVDAKRALSVADAVEKEALNHVAIGTAIAAVRSAAKSR